ncbi:hypothetical protein PMAYCL1PPCAC_30261, partial [Pristionchus mayeri]
FPLFHPSLHAHRIGNHSHSFFPCLLSNDHSNSSHESPSHEISHACAGEQEIHSKVLGYVDCLRIPCQTQYDPPTRQVSIDFDRPPPSGHSCNGFVALHSSSIRLSIYRRWKGLR